MSDGLKSLPGWIVKLSLTVCAPTRFCPTNLDTADDRCRCIIGQRNDYARTATPADNATADTAFKNLEPAFISNFTFFTLAVDSPKNDSGHACRF